jgi:hypothetical protein
VEDCDAVFQDVTNRKSCDPSSKSWIILRKSSNSMSSRWRNSICRIINWIIGEVVVLELAISSQKPVLIWGEFDTCTEE